RPPHPIHEAKGTSLHYPMSFPRSGEAQQSSRSSSACSIGSGKSSVLYPSDRSFASQFNPRLAKAHAIAHAQVPPEQLRLDNFGSIPSTSQETARTSPLRPEL